jgi:hypothetical protein
MLHTNPKFAPLVEIQEELDKLTTAWFQPNCPQEAIYEYRNMLEDKLVAAETRFKEEFEILSQEDQDFWYRYFEKPEPTPYDAD